MKPIDLSYLKSDNLKKVLTILSIKGTAYIFEQNFHVLLDYLREYPSKTGENASFEFKRLLHNFLASSSTLIDHTRNLSKKCPEIETEYVEEVKNIFATSKICHFVKGLRNYMTHYDLPLSMIQLKLIESDKIGGDLVLDRNKLLQWDSWSSYGKQFLNDDNSNIKVQETRCSRFFYRLTFPELQRKTGYNCTTKK